MNTTDYIIIAVVLVLVGGVVAYLRHAKKKGVKCVGCPDSGTCSGHCAGCNSQCGSKKDS